jgi:DNA-directed RNA polymerase subunit RPC12/RpoP
MVDDATTTSRIVCLNCGFEPAAGSDEWGTADHPSLGSLTQCPECSSTNTTSR